MDGLGYYEFFAGGGMARAGLGANWRCLLANDIDAKKAASYKSNWNDENFLLKDIRDIESEDIPSGGILAWASFPCQDLSLAGCGAGLEGERSGAFWPFWRLMEELGEKERAPAIIAIENVIGALSSHGGRDFAAIMEAMSRAGYKTGALIIDAAHFLPQSRPRLFITGYKGTPPAALRASSPDPVWHKDRLKRAAGVISPQARKSWIWWRLPPPPERKISLIDLLEDRPDGVKWHEKSETGKILAMMSGANLAKVERAKASGERMAGAIFRRTRARADGSRAQRAEIRFDGLAGCLRTPGGGSSRQLIMLVEGNSVKTRLLSPRECARLMGLPDSYILPERRNDAYHLTGDGLAVPAVSWLAQHLLEPLAQAHLQEKRLAAA
jgi:DNA (cytosine-5)-methyltransferase 1